MTTSATQPVPQYPLQDFFRNPSQAYFRLADDGRTLAFMQPAAIDGQAPRMNVFVQPLDGLVPTGEPRRVTAETERDISGFFWKGSRTVLYQKDFGGDENFHVLAVDVQSGQVRDLTPYDGVRSDIIDDLEEDPLHVLLAHNQRQPEVFDVYRVNVQTGDAELVATNPGNIVGWLTDHQGRVRLALASDGLETVVLYRDDESHDFRPLISTNYRTSVAPLFFDFDDHGFYALSNRGRDKSAMVRIDPALPDAETVVLANDQVDLGGAGYSRLRKVLTVAWWETDRVQHHFFDALSQRRHAALTAQLPEHEITIQSASRDERILVVAAHSDRTPGGRYLYDADQDVLQKLADINPALPPQHMAPMLPVQYASRDGLTIHGYLTLPVGRAHTGLACIVIPHGGPWVRDSWGFNPEVQFLVNRGFGVLQINYRGSTGYGRAFWEAGFGQWGLSMQDDITDGVQWLIDQGIADPARVGIYGASYGGYATLAGVAFTPDLYAAAVDYVGVSNLFTFMQTIPPYWKPMLEKMRDMVGDPERDRERLTATSPALHAERIKTPLFIAQGARDPRVNKAESDQMVEALRARGVQVEYMVRDNEGHGFHNDENKFAFYEAMEAFLSGLLRPLDAR